MIEVLVAGVVGIMLLTIATTWMIDMFRGSDRAAARAISGEQIDRAVARLQQDIAAMRAPDRGVAVYDPLDFRNAIRDATPLRGYDDGGSGPWRVLDVHDLRRATRSSLKFSTSSTGEMTCVRWRVDGGNLVRELLFLGGCGDPPSSPPAPFREVLIRAAADGRSTIRKPFSYELSEGPLPCTVQVRRAQLTAKQRSRVTAIRIDLQALAGNVRAEGKSGRSTSIAIRTRQAEEYQRALGCAR